METIVKNETAVKNDFTKTENGNFFQKAVEIETASESSTAINPAQIFQVGMGFWASKTLLTAIKLELFTLLGDDAFAATEIKNSLSLHERSLLDFLDALVALGFLKREGIGINALYRNTPETCTFLDKNKPSYSGGILEMANDRLYNFWSDLEEGLKTGKPQNEIKASGKSAFEAIYDNPQVLRQFLDAMAGIQMGNFIALSEKVDFGNYNTLCDIGGANGMLSICVAQKNPHIKCLSVDLSPVTPIALETVEKCGLSDQVEAKSLDMIHEDFPSADVITMGNILHDWDLERKKFLIKKAYEALPPNGALIVIENIIDDERKENVFGLLMSLNMLIETEGGFDYSYAQFELWAREAGFKSAKKVGLNGPCSAIIAYK